jgi:ribose-phosphate pyrophosphokinase
MDLVALHAFPEDKRMAQALAQELGLALKLVDTHRFPDGEIAPRVSGAAKTVLAYRSLANPNVKVLELLLACDAWRRAGAERLVLVAPYLCYMRQDAVFAPGEPVSQRVVAGLLGQSFDRIVTVDAHLHRTKRLDDLVPGVQWTNLSAAGAVAAHLQRSFLPENLLILGPDAESAPWVAGLVAAVDREGATFAKTRQSDRKVALKLPDSTRIKGRPVLLLDDICSSGGTLVTAALLLADKSAGPVDVIVTHALFSSQTQARLMEAGVRHVLSCDSCLHPTNQISLAPLLAQALKQEVKP